jgi:hypothetical protein
MRCVPFWLDDPITALRNIRSILPRAHQCINEKLNALAMFSVLFAAVLYVAKVKFYWAFAVFGVLISIVLKLVYFDKRKGELTLEQYNEGLTMDDLEQYLTDDEDEPERLHGVADHKDFEEFKEEAYFIDTSPHMRENTDGSFRGLKESVANDLLRSRIPNVIPLTKRLGDICIV